MPSGSRWTQRPRARLPARDVGGSLGYSPSLPLSQRKGPMPASALQFLPVIEGLREVEWRLKGEGKADINSKHTHLSTSNLFPQHSTNLPLSTGGMFRGPNLHFLWPFPRAQTAEPLDGDCMFPMQLAQGPRLLWSHWVAQTSHSPEPGFPLSTSQGGVCTAPLTRPASV